MDSILNQGLTLAAFGMGTVFFFLTLLVLATMAMSALVAQFSPPAPAPVANQVTGVDGRKLAAITAAVHRHREEHES